MLIEDLVLVTIEKPGNLQILSSPLVSMSHPGQRPTSDKRFGIGSMLMIVLVASLTLGVSVYLVNAAMGDLSDTIWFFPLTCLAPMLLMIVCSWCFKLYRFLNR
jgi:hypothetical protein